MAELGRAYVPCIHAPVYLYKHDRHAGQHPAARSMLLGSLKQVQHEAENTLKIEAALVEYIAC